MTIGTFKARLEEARVDISERLKRIDKHIHHREPASIREADELSTEHQNDDVVLALDATLGFELKQIESALKRIELGEFGICRRCKGEIGNDRLDAIPYAETCATCAGLV